MKNILIVLGHPDTKSFCGALADEYQKGAKKSKFKIRRINLGELKFDPILHHGYNKIQELETDLAQAQKDILWADHIVWIYPTWWGDMPALLKGFLDRTILPGFGFKYTGPNTWKRFLKGKSARIITAMGGKPFLYKLVGSPGIRALKYPTLIFCGVYPVRVTMFGAIRKSLNPKRAQKILGKVKKLGLQGK
ncbi:MAG: NAD(P)H-dependent oxidoreductase [Patescibacteria group bacterium]